MVEDNANDVWNKIQINIIVRTKHSEEVQVRRSSDNPLVHKRGKDIDIAKETSTLKIQKHKNTRIKCKI